MKTIVYELTVRAFYKFTDEDGDLCDVNPSASVMLSRDAIFDINTLLAVCEKTLEVVSLENLRPSTHDEADECKYE